jgi:hypothetical protein
MPEETRNQQTQQIVDSATVLRSWVENLKSKFNSNDGSTLQIYFGSTKIYDQVGNNSPQVDRLGDAIGRKFQQALENPTVLKGGIRILADGMKVYQARSGDKLDAQYSLNSVPKPSLNQTQATSKETIPQEQTKQQPTASWNDIRSLIAEQKQNPEGLENAIFQLLVDQATRINQLEQKVEAISQNKSLNANFGKWLGELQQGGKEALQELKGRARQVPQGILQVLGDTRNKIQDNLKRRLADVAGNTLNAGTRYLAERFGQDNGDGVKVFKGNSLIIAASAQHSGIYNKDGQKLVQDGQIISPVTPDQLSKIAQVPVEAQKLKQGEKQVAIATKALRA